MNESVIWPGCSEEMRTLALDQKGKKRSRDSRSSFRFTILIYFPSDAFKI